MLNTKQTHMAVAGAMFEGTFRRTKWGEADKKARAEALADARTVISAYELGQTREEAAARLATWYFVDRKQPHVAWQATDESIQNVMRRKANIGFDAITACLIFNVNQEEKAA